MMDQSVTFRKQVYTKFVQLDQYLPRQHCTKQVNRPVEQAFSTSVSWKKIVSYDHKQPSPLFIDLFSMSSCMTTR